MRRWRPGPCACCSIEIEAWSVTFLFLDFFSTVLANTNKSRLLVRTRKKQEKDEEDSSSALFLVCLLACNGGRLQAAPWRGG